MFDRAFGRLPVALVVRIKWARRNAVLMLAGAWLSVGSASAANTEWPQACAFAAWRASCDSPTVRAPLRQIEAVLELYPVLGGSTAALQARQEQAQWLDSPPTDCATSACWSAHALHRLSELAGALSDSAGTTEAVQAVSLSPDQQTLKKSPATSSLPSSLSSADEPLQRTRAKLDGTQIYALAQRASVFMMGLAQGQPNKKIFGSGVILAPGLVATNYHVVRKAGSMSVLYQDRSYRFSVVAGDIGLDLVLLRVPGLPGTVLPLAPLKLVQPGQRVYAFGSPYGFTQSISDGIVSAVRPHFVNKSASIIQVTAPISPGSSGGGLFDEQGALVGFTTATYKSGQNINFAIPAELVKTLPPMTLFR